MRIKFQHILPFFLLIFLSISSYSDSIPQDGTKLDFIKSKSKQTETIEQDTLSNPNRISRVDWRDERVNIDLELEQYGVDIQITIYNMLAKPVKSRNYRASEVFANKTYTFENTSDLPQGHYFCILVGPGFQDTYKFTIQR
jgi:hypothetical protein